MPLQQEWAGSHAALETVLAKHSAKVFLYFYGAKDNETKRSWCGDCVNADPVLEEAIDKLKDKIDAVIVHVDVGDRQAFRDKNNAFRSDGSLNVRCIPILMRNEDRTQRLEEAECADPKKVQEFLKQ